MLPTFGFRPAEDGGSTQARQCQRVNAAKNRRPCKPRMVVSVRAAATETLPPSQRVVVTGMGVVTSLGFDVDTFYKCGVPRPTFQMLRARPACMKIKFSVPVRALGCTRRSPDNRMLASSTATSWRGRAASARSSVSTLTLSNLRRRLLGKSRVSGCRLSEQACAGLYD